MKLFKKGQKVKRASGGNAVDLNVTPLNMLGTFQKDWGVETVFEIEGTVKLATFIHTPNIYGAYLLKKDGVDVGYVYNTYIEEVTTTIPLTKREILELMFTDVTTYKEDIIELAMNDSKSEKESWTLNYWDAWFRGATGQDLERAEKGIIYKG